jgi:hypothetical protein
MLYEQYPNVVRSNEAFWSALVPRGLLQEAEARTRQPRAKRCEYTRRHSFAPMEKIRWHALARANRARSKIRA